MNLKKNIVAGFIFILILAGITISLSNYASKTGKSHQAAEEIAEGESEESDSCFTYEELPDGTLRITGYDEEKNMQNPYQVTIPSTIDGKQVSTLGKECLGASYAGNLLELTISDGITTIEENIIENASDIGLIKLPDSVISIDEKAFGEMTASGRLRLPARTLPMRINMQKKIAMLFRWQSLFCRKMLF